MALLVLTFVPGASAAPSAADLNLAATAAQVAAARDANGCDGTQGEPYASGLPAIPYCSFVPGGPNRYQDYGGVAKTTTQTAVRPKLTFNFPPVVLRTFFTTCYYTATPLPCPVKIEGVPPYDQTVTPYYVGLSTDVWVQSEPGATPQYGDFPPVTVTGLAFGAIPVTATVTVKQVRDATGLPSPLNLRWILSGPVRPGKTPAGYSDPKYPKGAPVFTSPPNAQAFFTPAPEIDGRVVITLSEVKIDQVPIDVGPACQAQTNLGLTATGGFYNGNAPPKEGEAGEFAPVNNQFPDNDQYLRGSIDIPAFTGCTDGSQDFSQLLTATVSGPGNTVRVVLDGALKNFGCLAKQTDGCDTQHPPYYVPPDPNP